MSSTELFNSKSDEQLWLKLNAEHQIESDKKSKGYSNSLHPRTMKVALGIAKNQLDVDKKIGKLRFTLEDYLTLSFEQLKQISQQKHEDWWKKFNKLK